MTGTLEDFIGGRDLSDSEMKRIGKKLSMPVIARFGGVNTESKWWPGGEKNVHVWVLLEDGTAVACNENPGYGMSYPSFKAYVIITDEGMIKNGAKLYSTVTTKDINAALIVNKKLADRLAAHMTNADGVKAEPVLANKSVL